MAWLNLDYFCLTPGSFFILRKCWVCWMVKRKKSFYSVPRIVTFFEMMLYDGAIEEFKLTSFYILISVWTVPIKNRKKEDTDIHKGEAMGIAGGGDWCHMDPYWINSAGTLQSEFWHLELQDNKFFLDTYWVVIYWASHMKAKQMSLVSARTPQRSWTNRTRRHRWSLT